MRLGLALIDVLYLAGLVALLRAAAAAGGATVSAASALPRSIAITAGLVAALATWIAVVAVAAALVPRPRRGRYPLFRHPVFYFWSLHFLLRRYLDIPPIQTIVFHSNLLRFLVLRALGARVRFTTSMSSDVVLLDPPLFEAGPGCVLGSQSAFTGHMITGGMLLLAPIRLGSRVEVGGRSNVGPGVVIGDDARIGAMVSLWPNVTVGDGAIIGPHARVASGARIGKRAEVPADAWVPPGAEIADGEVFSAEKR